MERRKTLKRILLPFLIIAFFIYQTYIGVMSLFVIFGISPITGIIPFFLLNTVKFIINKSLINQILYTLIIVISSFKYLRCFKEEYSDLRLLLLDCPDFFMLLIAIYSALIISLLVLSEWRLQNIDVTDTFITLLLLYVTSPIVRVSETEIILALIEIYIAYKVLLKNRFNKLFIPSLIFIIINIFNNLAFLFFDEFPKYFEVSILAEYVIIEIITFYYLWVLKNN